MLLKVAAAAWLIGALQIWSPFAAPASPSRADVAACLAAPTASARRIRADAVFFCGRINDASIEAFREVLRPTDRLLFIASFGGDLDAPIRLAEIVRDHVLAVSVVGPCLSGCASFVFVAGRGRSIAPGGVLGLHNTATSALLLARSISNEPLAAEDRPLELRARREAALYGSLGVDLKLLVEPQVRLETLCVEIGRPDTRTGETRFLIHSRHSLWAPTRAQWQAVGVYFSGYAPESGRQAQRLLDAAMPASARAEATITMSRMPLPAPPETYLADVERCAAATR